MMKIRIDETIYEGTGTEIMERLRLQTFDPSEYPDTGSYIRQLQTNFIRMTDRDCPIPESGTEQQARAMFGYLGKAGALEILEE